jgi:hypothetical protein
MGFAVNIHVSRASTMLVQNGAPRATIVIAQSAINPAKEDASAQKVSIAAHDLQDYIRKISGATLPIVDDKSTFTGNVILVGKSHATDQLKSEISSGLTPERKEEGFLIEGKNNHLVLAGNDAGPYHGTEYAVYNFLNRLGVRWFMPGDFGEYVPQQQTIEFADITIREKPDFIQRNWWEHTTPEMAALERRWKIRNGMNPDNVFATPTDSSVRNYIAAPDLAKTEPELFAKNSDGSVNPHLPNLSNPKTIDIAAQIVEKYFHDHPEEDSIGIAPDDGMPRDFTSDTVKRNQGFSNLGGREGVPDEMSATEEWIAWINGVTREVNKIYPNKIITTNGYANRNMPPFGVTINPHVSIMFAAIWSDTLHAYDDPQSWQMERQGQVLKRWCELNNKVWIYGYDYTMLASGLTPVPITRKLARDFPLMKKWGVVGFNDETRNIWAESGIPTKYIRAHLEWNANADVNALENDFYSKWYGAAAKPARAFWDAIEIAIENSPIQGHEDRVMPYIYSPELMQELAKDASAAERAADTPRDKLHVQIDRLIYQHLQAYVAMNKGDFHGDYAEAALQANLMLTIRPKLAAINSFLITPSEKNPNGTVNYSSGIWYWGVADRTAYYQKLVDMQSGKTGTLVAALPENAAFSTDPKDAGRFAGWYQSNWDTSKWKTVTTTKPFYLQGYMDKSGYPYLGDVWYQFKVNVPETARGQKVLLSAPVVETEAWAWVNGKYIGHRPYRESYERPNQLELDASDALKPGQVNVITIRVSTSLNSTAEAGGLIGRLFLYSPKS